MAGAHGAAQSRYVNPTNACHPTHPAVFLAGSKMPNGALPTKWEPVGHESCWGSSGVAGAHGAAQSRYVTPTNACHPTHPAMFLAGSKVPNGALPTKWQPVGHESCWGSAVSHVCSSATLAAVTCLWSGWCPMALPRAVTST